MELRSSGWVTSTLTRWAILLSCWTDEPHLSLGRHNLSVNLKLAVLFRLVGQQDSGCLPVPALLMPGLQIWAVYLAFIWGLGIWTWVLVVACDKCFTNWAVSPVLDTDWKRRSPCKDGGRDWSHTAVSSWRAPRILGTTRSSKRQGRSHSWRVWWNLAQSTPWFLISRLQNGGREYICYLKPTLAYWPIINTMPTHSSWRTKGG